MGSRKTIENMEACQGRCVHSVLLSSETFDTLWQMMLMETLFRLREERNRV